jgi:Kef-type K+ transport system membrane component KefB
MPRDEKITGALLERFHDLMVILFLPLFFAFTGLRTSVQLISGDLWAWCAVVILVAVAGKVGGSAIAARASGLTWREGWALGTLMNTRGLMELVILNVGLDLGVISPALFAMMVLMALATTLMTTPVLERIYPEAATRA